MIKRVTPVILFLTANLVLPVSCVEESLLKPKDGASAGELGMSSTSAIGISSNHPRVLVPHLDVRTVIGGLVTPIALSFIGNSDMLVVEKNTGRVLRVIDGVVTGTALDLAVNNASERGLLGIALHPNFP